MFNLLRKVAVCLLFLFTALPAWSDAIIASWNIEHLGWNNGKNIESVAEVAKRFDLIAIQEVMSEEGAHELQAELEKKTGVRWESLISHAVGRGSYKEMYAFLYRPDHVDWVDGAVVYIDDRNMFAREPFSARFRTQDGYEFVYATVHSIYGKTVAERQEEAVALRSYLDWLKGEFGESPIFLAGDFNLAPTNPAWGPVREIAEPLITEGNTTISTINGKFANLYDNIWAPTGTPLPLHLAGRIEFPHEILGITHKQARDTVSDHIPVWMWLSPDAQEVTFPSGPKASASGQYQFSPDSELAPIIGNKNSKIYHLPHCPGYTKTSPKNRAPFETEEDAIGAGYRVAKNC